ncbi:MAG TPA: hypothetical protein VFZ84_09255 [Burkholderiales bacterium]
MRQSDAHELLEDLLRASHQQTRLLEEIRELLSPSRSPASRVPHDDPHSPRERE